jgi:hypothetical protein
MYMYVCIIRIRMCVCVCVCVYIYIYVYIYVGLHRMRSGSLIWAYSGPGRLDGGADGKYDGK